MVIRFDWTDEKIAELIHYWNFERWSAQKISELMGITRNSAIGKIHRLKLPSFTEQNRIPRARVRGVVPKLIKINPTPPKVRPPTPVIEATVLSSDSNVTMEELNANHCRNIIGRENGEPIYCGASRLIYVNDLNQEVASPYCPVHHMINHQPARGREHGYGSRYR